MICKGRLGREVRRLTAVGCRRIGGRAEVRWHWELTKARPPADTTSHDQILMTWPPVRGDNDPRFSNIPTGVRTLADAWDRTSFIRSLSRNI